MKKHILSLGLLALTGAGLTSCEDFLTEKNPNEVTTDVYWTKIADCENGLTAVYNAFKNINIYSFTDENMRSDLAVQGGSAKRTTFTSTAYLQNFNDAEGVISNKWAALYAGAFRANQVLDGLDLVKPNLVGEGDLEKWNKIKAQAHFFRGLFYFYLHNSFNGGDVPILDYVPKKPSDFFRPVSASDDVKAFYRADLDSALHYGAGLIDQWDAVKDKGRITTAAIQTVLGMSYLYDKEYAIARTYFKSVIDDSNYQLSDIANNSTTKGELNEESILEATYTLDLNGNFTGESALYNQLGMAVSKKGWYSMVPAFWLVEAFENEPVDPKDRNNWVALEADTIVYRPADTSIDTIVYQPDLFYTKLGDQFRRSYTQAGSANITFHEDYVYHQNIGQPDYFEGVYKRVIRTNADGSMVDPTPTTPNPQYTLYAGNFYKPMNFHIFQEGGQYYRMRTVSPRASHYLCINGDEDLHYYQKSAQENAAFHNNETAYFRKYSNWDIWKEEEEGTPANQSGINLRLLRLADVYLMYAEALIEGGENEGGFSEALMYVNRVRRRAGATMVGSENDPMAEHKGVFSYEDTDFAPEVLDTLQVIKNAPELMNHLMYVERPLELCTDGFATRVIDMRRWGITKARFQELATQGYVMLRTCYIKEVNGVVAAMNSATNWGKQYRYDPANPTHKTPMFDYVQASINYTDEENAYWPIPSSEKTTNPYID